MVCAGTASKGLYRVHQFSKVEMFIVSTEAQSEGLLSELCQIEEEIFTELGLHYKVLVWPYLQPAPMGSSCSSPGGNCLSAARMTGNS